MKAASVCHTYQLNEESVTCIEYFRAHLCLFVLCKHTHTSSPLEIKFTASWKINLCIFKQEYKKRGVTIEKWRMSFGQLALRWSRGGRGSILGGCTTIWEIAGRGLSIKWNTGRESSCHSRSENRKSQVYLFMFVLAPLAGIKAASILPHSQWGQ